MLRFCADFELEGLPRPRVAGVLLFDGWGGNSGCGVTPLRVTRCDTAAVGKGEPKSTS